LLALTFGFVYFRTQNGLNSAALEAQGDRRGLVAPHNRAPSDVEAVQHAVDRALEAMQRGDLPLTLEIIKAARQQDLQIPGLCFQGALATFRARNPDDAEEWIRQSILADERVADCWYLRARFNYSTGGPAAAAEAFKQAARAEPFSPRSYFFRAECLRRNGNMQPALEQFQKALRCHPDPADTELIFWKMSMTRIEAGLDTLSTTKTRAQLSESVNPGDALLLAGAAEIARGDFAAAAEDIRWAARCMSMRDFLSRTRDYVFRTQAGQSDISAALKSSVGAVPFSEPGRSALASIRDLVDPATRSLAEADPAGW
jgi:tetratricopeptide (TPR) repeat protein